MRIEIGAVTAASGVVLAASATGFCVWAACIDPGTAQASGIWPYLAAGYGLTLLGFAAFPHRRRMDVVKAAVLIAVVCEAVQLALGQKHNLIDLLSFAAGAFTVLAPSYAERFRSLSRADPYEPVSLVFRARRRRRSDSRLPVGEPSNALETAA